jgi:hypothetical protein
MPDVVNNALIDCGPSIIRRLFQGCELRCESRLELFDGSLGVLTGSCAFLRKHLAQRIMQGFAVLFEALPDARVNPVAPTLCLGFLHLLLPRLTPSLARSLFAFLGFFGFLGFGVLQRQMERRSMTQ